MHGPICQPLRRWPPSQVRYGLQVLRLHTGCKAPSQGPTPPTQTESLCTRILQWANVQLQVVPQFPVRAPEFLRCYLDTTNPIFEPIMYTGGTPGSLHRVEFLKAMNQVLGVSEPESGHIAELVQCMHTCSLVVDDIIDDAAMRRGMPAAHTIYGVPKSLGSAYTALFQVLHGRGAFEMCCAGSPETQVLPCPWPHCKEGSRAFAQAGAWARPLLSDKH